ncbi:MULTISPECIES: hypothetical protein [unclassified Paraburkholderia]|uniref:hypothetical protein n=1 Tax=unclassified Paraburkholderia TaxID=2615204 RepID=UPI002AB0AED9|nr:MULTISPECIES: hypothetical protein [unclassified Paraburkholderia]
MGNGGFSLRSARLLKAFADERFVVAPDTVEDEAICQRWRPVLEAEYGMRYAPQDGAAQFSYEASPGARPSFGFHAVYYMWRHVDDSEMMAIMRDIDLRTFASNESLHLLTVYCRLQKYACVRAMYARYRSPWPSGNRRCAQARASRKNSCSITCRSAKTPDYVSSAAPPSIEVASARALSSCTTLA